MWLLGLADKKRKSVVESEEKNPAIVIIDRYVARAINLLRHDISRLNNEQILILSGILSTSMMLKSQLSKKNAQSRSTKIIAGAIDSYISKLSHTGISLLNQ